MVALCPEYRTPDGMGAIVNEIQRERSLAVDFEILFWNTLLIKAFQQDPQISQHPPDDPP
jgi:hypothetical protein